MAIHEFANAADARTALRDWGYRQITYPSQGDDEFWWRDSDAAAAEVARAKVLTYDRWTNAYCHIAGRVARLRRAPGRPPPKDEEP